MIKLAKIAMAASVFMMPLAANASLDGTYIGDVNVQKGISLNCRLNAVVENGGTELTALYITQKNFLDLLCPTVTFDELPYAIVPDLIIPNKYFITGVVAKTITPGDCAGDIDVTHDPDLERISINGTLPTADPNSADCLVSGDLVKQ